MSKIYVIPDHPGYNRTLPDVIRKWEEAGHEVKSDMYYDIEKANWADIIFGEYLQGGIIHAMQDESMKTPIVMRGIDIDLYAGHYLGVDWNRANAVLFINDYMREHCTTNYKSATGREINVPVETVHLGIDIDKFTFKDKSQDHGKTIGWLNNFWSGKGVELLLQIVYKLVKIDPEYMFDVVGVTREPWLEKYLEEFLKRNDLQNNVRRVQSVVDVNEWMDGIDYMITTSMKECMSLPIAEGMAKGIKPVIHNWWDARELYPKNLIFQSVDEAINIIKDRPYDSQSYRTFIETNYSLDKQLNSLNRILNL